MLYLIGHKSISLKTETVEEKCINCGGHNSIILYVVQKYVHFFGIPFLPAGKTGSSKCESCKQTLTEKQMPEFLLATYKKIKADSKTPFWMFSGSVLFAILFVILTLNEQKQKRIKMQFVLTPKTGDILEVKNKDNQYTTYLIADIKGDSIFWTTNKYQVNDPAELQFIKDSAYQDEIFYISKTELKKLFDKGNILNINRK